MWPKAVTVLALGAAAVATWTLAALIEHPIEWLAIASDQPQLPGWVAHALTTLFVYYAASVLVPFFLFVGWRTLANTGPTAPPAAPFVSIIIPAFDEEPHIASAIDAALDQDYPSYEVIIIDDGSRDFTKYVADRYDVVRLIALRANLGKAHALNAGLAQAMGSIVVCSDSDSALARDALKHLVAHFADPAVGAMAGTVEIPDPRSFAQRLQSIEYIYGQHLLKLAQLGSGSSVAVCPGPISAFRRTALLQIGGFTDRTLTEDFDATLELIRHGFAVGFDPRAVAFTSAPSTWQLLVKQRIALVSRRAADDAPVQGAPAVTDFWGLGLVLATLFSLHRLWRRHLGCPADRYPTAARMVFGKCGRHGGRRRGVLLGTGAAVRRSVRHGDRVGGPGKSPNNVRRVAHEAVHHLARRGSAGGYVSRIQGASQIMVSLAGRLNALSRVAVLVAAVVCIGAGLTSRVYGQQPGQRAPLVLLTFDTEMDEDVRAIRDLGVDVPVTYFITGEFAQRNGRLVRQLAERNSIGSHGYSHGNLKEMIVTRCARS